MMKMLLDTRTGEIILGMMIVEGIILIKFRMGSPEICEGSIRIFIRVIFLLSICHITLSIKIPNYLQLCILFKISTNRFTLILMPIYQIYFIKTLAQNQQMRKFQRKVHIPQNRLTKSTCLNSNDLQNNKQGSLDFSLQELNGDSYQAAFRIIQSLQNKITKTYMFALKQIQFQSICMKVQKVRRSKSLMIFLHLSNTFKRHGIEGLKKWERRRKHKIRSCQLVKNWLNRAIRKKKGLFFIRNAQVMSQLLKNYKQQSTNNHVDENIRLQLQGILSLHPKRNAKVYEQKLYELYPLLNEFIKKKKKPFKSNAYLLVQSFKNCIGFYKDMIDTHGSALNKMDEKLLPNLKKLQSQQQNISKYLIALKRTIDQQIVVCEKQSSRPQYQSRKNTLSMIKFLIQMLQKDEARQSKSTSSKKLSKQSSFSQIQTFNDNQCKIHIQSIETLNQKINELESKIKELEQEKQKQNKEKLLITEKNQQLLKLSKSIKALSKNNKSKASRLSSLRQQYQRFDVQYFKRKSQQVEIRNSLYQQLRLSREKFDQKQSTISLSKSHSGIKTEKSKKHKQSLLKLLFKVIDKAINLNKGQQADVWQQMKQITNTCKSVEDMHQNLEFFVVLFIERHKKNLKSLDLLSQSQQKSTKTNGLTKFLDFRSGEWRSSTPRKQQTSKPKYNKTVKR